jgi:hypothetical protein
MKSNVATCLLALLVGNATSAHAETVFVQQVEDRHDDVAVPCFEFGTNQTPSRAWVELYVYRREVADVDGLIDAYSIARAYVTGLSRTGDQIVFSSGSRTTLCATVVHHQFLFIKWDRVEKTGRCTVTTTPGVRQKDDGFKVTTVPVLNVYFEVRE